MTTPIDDRVGTVIREMLSATDSHRPPVDPSELRSRARRTALRRLDRKVLVAVAAVAALIVTLIAVGPLRSGTPPTHSPATRPTAPTTAPTTTTTVPVAAAAQLDTYVADEARTDAAAASASGVTARYGLSPFVSDHSAPVADGGHAVAVAAFSYDPGGHPVQVLAYDAGHWTQVAALSAPTGQFASGEPSSVVFLTAGPVSVADVTGDGPDFLVMASAADNVPGFVVSQAGGTWRYIPFLGPYAPTPTDVLGREPTFRGNTLVSDYDNCVPDCASGQNTTIVWTYQPSTGEFTAPNPPGYITPPTTTTVPGGQTRQITYQPFTAEGAIQPSLRISSTHSAHTCVGAGVAGNSSYRCFAGNGIFDPCFARPGATSGPLLCPTDPASDEVAELTTSSLPASLAGAPETRPWAIQLADGQVCVQVNAAWGGLGPLGCASTPPGLVADCHVPVTGSGFWTAACQDQETGTSPFTTNRVETVWF